MIFFYVYVTRSLFHEGNKLDKVLSLQPFMTAIEVIATVDNDRRWWQHLQPRSDHLGKSLAIFCCHKIIASIPKDNLTHGPLGDVIILQM